MNGQAKIQVRPAQPEEIPIVVGFVERMLCEQNRKTLDLDRAQMIQACQDILANDQQRISPMCWLAPSAAITWPGSAPR